MDFSSFLNGNVILCVIGGLSILAMGVFIERLYRLKRGETDTNRLIIRLRQTLEQGNIIEAIGACEESGGVVANIVKAGLLKHKRRQEQIEAAMEMQGMVEIASLEKNAKVLSIIAHIAPLIGLLGTVLGFIQAFSEMRQTGLMDISTSGIGEAMEYALITTAAGLVVAIPAVVGYNYIVSRIGSLILEMQTTSSEIVDLLCTSDHS